MSINHYSDTPYYYTIAYDMKGRDCPIFQDYSAADAAQHLAKWANAQGMWPSSFKFAYLYCCEPKPGIGNDNRYRVAELEPVIINGELMFIIQEIEDK